MQSHWPVPPFDAPTNQGPASDLSRRSFLLQGALWTLAAGTSRAGIPESSSQVPQLRTRRVWLRLLLEQVEEDLSAGQKLTEEERYLAGLTQVQFLYVDEEHRDVILEGPAEDKWETNAEGTVRGKASGRPLLQLDDLAVAWRNANDGVPPPSVSLEHRVESVRAVQAVVRAAGVVRTPAEREEFTKKLQNAWGPQDAVTGGVPTNTRFNQVMVEADWEMKRISLGLSKPGVEKLPTYIDLEFDDWRRRVVADPKNAGQPAGGSRFWFFPAYNEFAATQKRDAVAIPPNAVQLLTESHYQDLVQGKQIAPEPSASAKKFVEAFTDSYDKIARAKPVFTDLHNIFDWVAIARLIRMLEVPRRIGWDLGFLRSKYPVAEIGVPATKPGQVAIRHAEVKKTRREGQNVVQEVYNLVRPAWGGVSIDVEPTVNPARLRVEPGLQFRLRSALSSRPQGVGYWWQQV